MKRKKYNYLIVGAGLFGATFANIIQKYGNRCLVIDKRPHLGGNVYCEDIDGITVHKYGPHIFHTNNEQVWKFVNSFVPFHQFQLNTIANYKGKLYNLPFNMNTFHQMWGVITPEEANAKLKEQIMTIENPQNLEQQALSLVGPDIYNTLIKGYTEKQWEKPCTELPASIIKRLPVRLTYNNNYFNDCYQGIPNGGYNELIRKMLEGIECKTNCDFFSYRENLFKSAVNVVYTGSLDQFFDYKYGKIEYRSLRFENETLPLNNYQGNAIINYTDINHPYTRIVEHKHFDITNVDVMKKPFTVITREYPETANSVNEPYYPINDRKDEVIIRAIDCCNLLR